MTRRFWVCVALSIPLLLMGMSELFPGAPLDNVLPMSARGWVELALATPVVIWGASRATMKNIKQNLFFAFVYNTLGVPVAAGVLYPFFGLLLSPMIAAAAMSFSSVSVIARVLRLRKARI